jgi:hypothetical protein
VTKSICGAIIAAAVMFSSIAFAQFGPAPDGEPTVIAQKIIRRNFAEDVCSLVVEAHRLGDGSIRAKCNNGEIFRIIGENIAMRCSVAAGAGVSGC